MFFKLEFGLPSVPLVVGGALCAASGRLVLAHASRRFRRRLSPARVGHLGIGLQIAMLLALVALLRVDWASRLARHARGRVR